MTYDLLERLHRGQVLEEIRVRNLARSPKTLVFRVRDLGCLPWSFECGVGLVWASDNSSVEIIK
jgi:hypothetical protein